MASLSLTTMQIEAIKEVGNIGAGHAATALSLMLSEPVYIGTPRVEILPFSGLADRVSRSDRRVSVVHMHVHGQAPCQIMVVFDEARARSFVDIFMNRTASDEQIADSIVESTIKEVGNIIGGAYLTALTALTGVTLIASVPTLSTGSADSALVALTDISSTQDVFYVQTDFARGEPVIGGEFILIPAPGSIDALLSVFNV